MKYIKLEKTNDISLFLDNREFSEEQNVWVLYTIDTSTVISGIGKDIRKTSPGTILLLH